MRADAESSCTESRTDSWSPDGARNPCSAPTTESWAPTPRMKCETPGQRPRPNYGHPHRHNRQTPTDNSFESSQRHTAAASSTNTEGPPDQPRHSFGHPQARGGLSWLRAVSRSISGGGGGRYPLVRTSDADESVRPCTCTVQALGRGARSCAIGTSGVPAAPRPSEPGPGSERTVARRCR